MRVAITGAATGIGAETCKILKARGDEIVAFDIKPPEHDVDAFHQIDLSDMDAIAEVAASVDGPFDALLNIAGLPPDGDNAALILAVNVWGLRKFTLEMIDKLSEDASIVNMASAAGGQWRANIDQVKAFLALTEDVGIEEFCRHHEIDATRAYNLSKEAVIVWTMAQTEQLIARGLRMNSVSPGGIATGIFQNFREAFGERVDVVTARTGRPGNPNEVAELAVFLASPESHWIKGTDVPINGGGPAMMISDQLGLEEISSKM